MSLAITALVKPSRLLRLLLASYALACLAAAWTLLASSSFHFGHAGAAACLLGAILAAQRAWRVKMTRRIDISGLGELRLTVQHGMGNAALPGELVALLPGSTLWPHCLLLLLRDADTGAGKALTILPDSMPADLFRNVSVALRAIARRDS